MQRHHVLFSRLNRRFLSVCVSLFLWIEPDAVSAHAGRSAQNDNPTLELSRAVEREVSGKKIDDYVIPLHAGEYAAITAEQRGIDVVVEVRDPGGKTLAEFDSESLIRGQEHICVFAESDGLYQIRVKPRYPKADAGLYQIRVDAIRHATEQDQLLFEARELSTQSQDLNGKGKYDEARQLAARALESAEKAVAPNDAYLGEVLVKLAELERTKDNRARAEELFQRAIVVDQAALGRENPQTALALQRLGALYNSMDDYLKAEPLLSESLAITEKTLGSEHPRMVVCLMNMSVLHDNRQEGARSLLDLQRALPIAEKSLEPDDLSFIGVVNNLGVAYRNLKDYDRAEPFTQRTLQLLEKKFGPEHPRLVMPLMNLGIIARERKQYGHSLELLWRSEAIGEKSYGARNSETARILIAIGNTYRAQGDYEKALETYRRARDILQAVAGPYDVLFLLTYVNSAIAYAALGDIPHAVEYQTRMESIQENSIKLNLAIGSEREKFDYLSAASERTDRTVSLNVQLAPHDPTAAQLAALVVLQRKGRVLDAMSGGIATIRERLTGRDHELLDELNKTTAQLAKLALNGAGKTSADDYQKQLAAQEDDREKLEAEISSRSAEFRLRAQTVTLAAVQAAIPRQAALIEFATYRPFNPKAESETRAYEEPHYVAYVLRQQGDVRWRELGAARAIDDAVAAFRRALREPDSKDVQQSSRILDEAVMEPIRPLLEDSTQLLISPDGQLNLIPFEAFLDGHGQYLVERYSISYLTAGRDLLRLQAERPSKSGPVLVADPFFGEPARTQGASVVPAKPESKIRRTVRRSVTSAGDLSSVYFAPLDGTALEARSIKALFRESTMLTGQHATQAALMRIEAPSILHIATHGFFLTNADGAGSHGASDPRGTSRTTTIKNPLLRSGLALTGANLKHEGNEKGILTALEASNLNLWGTKLVTLSACDTGVGDIRNGEGVYGLRRAFILAGAETVVMSLWPVSDYVTRELMTSYYTGLNQGVGRGEALRQTKLAMLKRKDRRHPFFWASFIQTGEWAALDGERR